MSIRLTAIHSRADLARFRQYPYDRYRNDPCWVPPLRLDQKMLLDRDGHPFYLNATAEFFLAERDGRVCGRIGAIDNRAYREYTGENTGFFGFFETEEDPETARRLLEAAADWCAGRGLTSIQGPANPSTNYECALLVDGHGEPPAFMMPYNPPVYATFIETAGFEKVKDMFAFWLRDHGAFPEKLEKITDRVMQRAGLAIRTVRPGQLRAELERVFAVYNDAWQKNWGFVPMSREEMTLLADNLKWVWDPRIILMAEVDDEPVGFLLAMPDLNRILARLDGRLLPLGWWRLLRQRRRLGVMRVMAMGFRREYQNIGFAAAIYRDIIRLGRAAGYDRSEISWVLEDNVMMVRAAEMLGAERYKTYRMYGRAL